MNCNLTDKDRENGMNCRSWDCQPCLEFKTSKHDVDIIKTHMENMQLKQQLEELQSSFNSVHKIMDRGQEENYKLKQQLESVEKENRGLKMMLNHVAGVEHVCEDLEVKLAEAVELIESLKLQRENCDRECEHYHIEDDNCRHDDVDDKVRQFLAKYRGEKFN